jgi:hypothetical protein
LALTVGFKLKAAADADNIAVEHFGGHFVLLICLKAKDMAERVVQHFDLDVSADIVLIVRTLILNLVDDRAVFLSFVEGGKLAVHCPICLFLKDKGDHLELMVVLGNYCAPNNT